MTFEPLKSLKNPAGSTLGDYKFLYGFVSLVKPRWILDIGTNYGLSAITMAMALRDSNLRKSKILSIDINENLLEKASTQIHDLGLSQFINLRCCTSSALDSTQFFDIVFIDGEHTFEGCMTDFHNVKDKATYILIHDTSHLDDISAVITSIEKMRKYRVLNIDTGNKGEQWSMDRVIYRSFPGITIIKVRK